MGSGVLSKIHMLWSTAVAVMIVQQRLGSNCSAPPEMSRQRNLAFHRAKALSMVFRVLVWAFWYFLWGCVNTLLGLKGVSKYGWMPYPLSPSSQPFLPPPPSRFMCSMLAEKMAESWTLPCHLHTKLVNNSCALHTAMVFMAWKPLWHTYKCSWLFGALMVIFPKLESFFYCWIVPELSYLFVKYGLPRIDAPMF